MDGAARGTVGVTGVNIEANEYLLLLHAADNEVNFGTDPQRIRDAADRLRAVSPEHVLVRLLDEKVKRANVVQELLHERVRTRAGKPAVLTW